MPPGSRNPRNDKAAALAREHPDLDLAAFLALSGMDLDDVYAANRSWSDLRADAGLPVAHAGPHEQMLRRACGRLFHVDDPVRLDPWSRVLGATSAPDVSDMDVASQRLLRMLLAQLLDQLPSASRSGRPFATGPLN